MYHFQEKQATQVVHRTLPSVYDSSAALKNKVARLKATFKHSPCSTFHVVLQCCAPFQQVCSSFPGSMCTTEFDISNVLVYGSLINAKNTAILLHVVSKGMFQQFGISNTVQPTRMNAASRKKLQFPVKSPQKVMER